MKAFPRVCTPSRAVSRGCESCGHGRRPLRGALQPDSSTSTVRTLGERLCKVARGALHARSHGLRACAGREDRPTDPFPTPFPPCARWRSRSCTNRPRHNENVGASTREPQALIAHAASHGSVAASRTLLRCPACSMPFSPPCVAPSKRVGYQGDGYPMDAIWAFIVLIAEPMWQELSATPTPSQLVPRRSLSTTKTRGGRSRGREQHGHRNAGALSTA